MSLSCLIIDDNPLAVDLLAAYVTKLPTLLLVGTATDPLEGLRLLREQSPQLVFLDIQMPGMSGLEFLHAAAGCSRFILVTAYPDHALEGFEHGVADYLLKPVAFERFCKAVNRVLTQQIITQPTGGMEPSIFVRTEQRLQKVTLKDIRYLESLQNYVILHLPEGKLVSLQPLKRIATELPAGQFLQIHRSYIVNLAQVTAFERNRVQVGETWLPLGDLYRQAFHAKMRSDVQSCAV